MRWATIFIFIFFFCANLPKHIKWKIRAGNFNNSGQYFLLLLRWWMVVGWMVRQLDKILMDYRKIAWVVVFLLFVTTDCIRREIQCISLWKYFFWFLVYNVPVLQYIPYTRYSVLDRYCFAAKYFDLELPTLQGVNMSSCIWKWKNSINLLKHKEEIKRQRRILDPFFFISINEMKR